VSIAATMQAFLAEQGITYDTIPHRHTRSNLESAHRAHVPEDCVVKAVVLEDDQGYLMALVPADHHVQLGKLGKQLSRPGLRLATEHELNTLFTDCALGAVPPLGAPYGMAMVMERSLVAKPELYLEAGDHEHLLHLDREEFVRLMQSIENVNYVKKSGAVEPGLRMAELH
jgi:Ala-tRNA(Pro) deacylase